MYVCQYDKQMEIDVRKWTLKRIVVTAAQYYYAWRTQHVRESLSCSAGVLTLDVCSGARGHAVKRVGGCSGPGSQISQEDCDVQKQG